MRTSFLLTTMCVLACIRTVTAQTPKDTLRDILRNMARYDDLSYSYRVNVTYPDNSKHKLEGTMYMDKKARCMYNDSRALTMIYTDRWFYKADHGNKSITLLDLNKEENADVGEAVKNGVLTNTSFNEFLDSVVYAYSRVKSYKRVKDTLKAELTFPSEMSLKRIVVTYHIKTSTMLKYEMDMFIPTDEEDGRLIGSSQYMVCTNFSSKKQTRFQQENYFSFNGKNAATLRKFTNYTLNTSY